MLPDASRLRLRLLGIVGIALFGAMMGRLWFVQVVEAETYQETAASISLRRVAVEAPRGRIFDVNGVVIVDNRLTNVLVVDRQALADADLDGDERRAMFVQLAGEINAVGGLVKANSLEAAYTDLGYSNLEEVPIAWDVDEELLVFVGERRDDFPGLAVRQRLVRTYPYGSLAAHLLGYTGAVNSGELAEVDELWEARGEPNPKPYTGRDSIGKTGVELLFEGDLRGVPGERVYEVDAEEQIVREILDMRREPIPGNDLFLTIDAELQGFVESQLAEGLLAARQKDPRPGEPNFDAPAGAAVVTDPGTGAVLAMASHPTYNPADLIDGVSAREWAELTDPVNDSPILNRAVQSVYSPGSTFKPFTALAALEQELFGRGNVPAINQTIPDEASYKLQSCDDTGGSRCTFSNARDKVLVGVDLPVSLTASSDTYYYRLGEAVWYLDAGEGDEAIQDKAAEFGMGRPSGIELPNERAGLLPTSELKAQRHEQNPEAFPFGDWFLGDNVNIAIGQGDLGVTPLQLANAYATLGNGGTLYQPTLVSRITTHEGEVLIEFGERVRSTVEIPPEHRIPLLEGLNGVTAQGLVAGQGGTAYPAFNLPGEGGVDFPLTSYPIAGKTGTAEVNGKADTALFAAWGPSVPYLAVGLPGPEPEPEYAMAVILEEAGFGSRSAAPIVARLFQALTTNSVPLLVTEAQIAAEFHASLEAAAAPPVDEAAGETEEVGE